MPTKKNPAPRGESLLSAWVKPRDVSIRPSQGNETLGTLLMFVLVAFAFVAWSIMGQAFLAVLLATLATLVAFANRVSKWMTLLLYATIVIVVSIFLGPLVTLAGFGAWTPVLVAVAVVAIGAWVKTRLAQRKEVVA